MLHLKISFILTFKMVPGNITYHLLILFVGPKQRTYGTETVVNVPVSVLGLIRDGTETGAHLVNTCQGYLSPDSQ